VASHKEVRGEGLGRRVLRDSKSREGDISGGEIEYPARLGLGVFKRWGGGTKIAEVGGRRGANCLSFQAIREKDGEHLGPDRERGPGTYVNKKNFLNGCQYFQGNWGKEERESRHDFRHTDSKAGDRSGKGDLEEA